MTEPVTTKAFVCYSHQDALWLERLMKHLGPLEHGRALDVWSDKKISTGSKWREEIEQSLNDCSIAIVLVSADLFASKFIQEFELPTLLQRAHSKGVKVIPIIVAPSAFKTSELAVFQAANDPDKSMLETKGPSRERLFASVADDIRKHLSARVRDPQIRDDAAPGLRAQPRSRIDQWDYGAYSRDVFEGVEVFVPNLVRDVLPPIIRNRTFRNCTILGPAVLYPSPDAPMEFVDCQFDVAGSIDSMFITLDRSPIVGIIGLRATRFHGCRFHSIAFIGPLAYMASIKAQLSGKL